MVEELRIPDGEVELSLFNGKDCVPAYFAYQGIVDDASPSYHWRGGRHWVVHRTGKDLSGELVNAAHDHEMLKRLKVMGVLTE